MFKKTYLYAGLQVVISFIWAWYLQSISDKKLLLADEFLNAKSCNKLLEHPFYVIIILSTINLLCYILSQKDNQKEKDQRLYNNICQTVFDEYINKNKSFINYEYRVSLFMVKEGYKILKTENFFKISETKYLVNVGRYQTRQNKKMSAVVFLPGQGSVGICYELGTYHFETTCEYNTNNTQYYEEQKNKFHIPAFKLKKVREKSRSFVSFPIKFFNSQDLFGVIVIDTKLDLDFSRTKYKVIEDVLHHHRVFFNQPQT